jgi:Protein kinase domain/Domain of Unknown Function (DUF1080)
VILGQDLAPAVISFQKEGFVMAVMEKKSTVHPSEEELRLFGQGRMPAEEAAALEEHLAGCESCCQFLEDSPHDSFEGRLREAKDPPLADVHLNDVPLELADHPRYQVLRLLGRGGMGAVYLAKHKRMGRAVALKVIHPEVLNHPGALCRFEQEARAAAQLDHPNIVAAYDADQAGDLHFLVMEYVEGQNLADHLAVKGPLPIAQACEIVRQAALGLEHAHERGMVHRDIKPHNLMRMPDGRVKVLDFGLALLKEDGGWMKDGNPDSLPDSAIGSQASTARLTGVGAVIGTADYIAPEQVHDARGADGRADVYSLGCVLYHLLAGAPPFPEGTTAQKLHLHAVETPRPLGGVRSDAPEELASIVARMMAKKPEDRCQTAAEVAAALAPLAVGPLPKRARLRRILFTLAGLLLVLFLLAAGAGVMRLSAGRDREIVIETDDPTIEVVVKGDRIVRIVDPKTGRAYQLDREELTLSLVDDPDGLAVTLDGKNPMVLKRQGKRIATVRLQSAARPIPPEKSPERPFNGKDLTGWVVDGERLGVWRVEDGELVAKTTKNPDTVWLLTERSYSDFRLRFEFQTSPGANSGVALRAAPGEKHVKDVSLAHHLEVQILDDGAYRKPDGSIPCPTGMLFWAAGDASCLRPDRLADLRPLGSWNEMTIETRGASLQVWVNGREILRTDLDKLARQSSSLPGLHRSSGRIGFQRHTGAVRFRNIEIKELPPSEKVGVKDRGRFFNGKNLTGWKGLPGYWSVEGGAIIGACPPEQPAHTFLVSEKSYKDFDLKFQVRRLDGIGNTGVQFRSRIADLGNLTVVGPQCEIDSASHKYPPGSLLTEPDLKPLAEKSPRAAVAAKYRDADFNDFHIRCVGNHVVIKVNEVTAIDDDYPDLPDEGVIAWQMHGYRTPREVRFRNIEFTDLSEGFKPLPVSKGLPDWILEGDESRFRTEGGVLVGTSPQWQSRGYLLREGQYANYRLRFECRLEEGANCGVVVRGRRGERSDFAQPGAIDHPVIKLTDARGNPNLPPGGSHWVASGDHYGPRPRDVPFPVGEWNKVELEVKGTSCRVWLNTVLAASLNLDEANRSGHFLPGLARDKGHIGFQANGGTVRFRHIEIQELPLPE